MERLKAQQAETNNPTTGATPKATTTTPKSSTSASSDQPAPSNQPDPRVLPDAKNGEGESKGDEEPQQQPTNLEAPGAAPSGGGRGFFNTLLDLYEGRGEHTRSSAAPAQTPQMVQQLEMSYDDFKNERRS